VVRIRYRIFAGFTLIFALGLYFITSWILTDVYIQPKKSMEESLVDLSHILASYLEQQIEEGKISTGSLAQFIASASKREFYARIYELTKKKINLRILVTDHLGVVIYDSDNGAEEGKNYSRWNDVRRTLEGRYGARTTRTDPDEPVSSVAYISAPIYYQEKIIGVVSVAKPWYSIHSFTRSTHRKIIIATLVGSMIVLLLTYLISIWITRPILRLTEYADLVRLGERISLPPLGKGEMQVLGEAFENMRAALEGKAYIETYIQNLTHQLKGPLSSIQGAAELLQEKLPAKDRQRFISNINKESKRIRRIIDRLLELASLEKRQGLQQVDMIDMKEAVQEVLESLSPQINRKKISCNNHIESSQHFRGERFLIVHAIYNLLQNAVAFTPKGGTIEISSKQEDEKLVLSIRDSGSGIPAYAQNRIFDKFYSLPRPGSDEKSSGLGLSMVKEVVELHQGDITLKNNPDQGMTATMKLPVRRKKALPLPSFMVTREPRLKKFFRKIKKN
jgi:two-component system sensor histidine kinase CreC